jgi:hypothetical protein
MRSSPTRPRQLRAVPDPARHVPHPSARQGLVRSVGQGPRARRPYRQGRTRGRSAPSGRGRWMAAQPPARRWDWPRHGPRRLRRPRQVLSLRPRQRARALAGPPCLHHPGPDAPPRSGRAGPLTRTVRPALSLREPQVPRPSKAGRTAHPAAGSRRALRHAVLAACCRLAPEPGPRVAASRWPQPPSPLARPSAPGHRRSRPGQAREQGLRRQGRADPCPPSRRLPPDQARSRRPTPDWPRCAGDRPMRARPAW